MTTPQNTDRNGKQASIFRAIAFAFIFAALVGAGIVAGVSVPAPPGRAAEQVDGILKIREVESNSGVTAWLVEDHAMPVIAMSFSFHGAGAALDPADKQGLSLLASNTMDEGAGNYDSQAFQKALADHSISLSFSSGRDDFGGSLKTLKRHSDLAFDLLRLALNEPRFDADAVERMRAANMARVRNAIGDPNWIAARIMNDVAFGDHPYSRNSGGTLTTLAAITPDDLRQFAATRLGRAQLYVTIVGDIAPEDVKKRLDEVFGALPEQATLPVIADSTVQNGGTVAHYDMDIPQTIIEIMQPGIGRDHPDYYPAAVMDFIFGGSGFGSRLTEEAREKRGLTYGIHSGFYMLDHVKAYTVSTSTANENAAAMMEIIRTQMQRMAETPVTDKEIADAKSYLIGSLPLALSSTDAIAGLLLGLRLEGLPMDYLDQRAAKIEAVSAADVQRVAQEILRPEDLTVVTVGRPENMQADNVIETLPNVD